MEQVQISSPLEKLTQSRALVDTTQHNTTLAAYSLLPIKPPPSQIHHDRPSLANVGFDLEKKCWVNLVIIEEKLALLSKKKYFVPES